MDVDVVRKEDVTKFSCSVNTTHHVTAMWKQGGSLGVGEPKARRASARGQLLVVELTSQGVAALWPTNLKAPTGKP
jgi:hypothetical protein